MTKRFLGPREAGSYLSPEAIFVRVRVSFPTVTVGDPNPGASLDRRERNWLLDRVLGATLAEDAMERLHSAIYFSVADEYGEPSLRCCALPNRPLEIELVDRWLEWPGYFVRDREGAERLIEKLGEVLGYSPIAE